MASRRIKNYTFGYTNDWGQTVIKTQKVYLDDSGETIEPLTPLFFARVIDLEGKVTSNSQELRHLKTRINGNYHTVILPYNPDESELLKAHIEEILAVETVDCASYIGEQNINNGDSNSF